VRCCGVGTTFKFNWECSCGFCSCRRLTLRRSNTPAARSSDTYIHIYIYIYIIQYLYYSLFCGLIQFCSYRFSWHRYGRL
jgi:hypothetical protein